MSAYGAIKRASEPLVAPKLLPRSYALPKGDNVLTVFPVRRETVTEELITYLQGVFNAVVEEGRTYPQMGVQSFEEFVSPSKEEHVGRRAALWRATELTLFVCRAQAGYFFGEEERQSQRSYM